MSDFNSTDTESELRGTLDDLRQMQAEFNERQKAIDRQRIELAKQVQQTKDEVERKLAEHKKQHQEVQEEQAQLTEQRAPNDESIERVATQLGAKRANATADTTHSQKTGTQNSGAQELGDRKQGAQEEQPRGMTTKADIEKLKSQTGQPTADLTFDPPGMGTSQASQVDRDLRLMNEAREKQERLDQASQNMRDNWNQSSGPKR